MQKAADHLCSKIGYILCLYSHPVWITKLHIRLFRYSYVSLPISQLVSLPLFLRSSLYRSTYKSFYFSECPSIYLCIHFVYIPNLLTTRLYISVSLPTCLTTRMFVPLHICLALPTWWSLYASLYPYVCLSTSLSVSLQACMFLYPYLCPISH